MDNKEPLIQKTEQQELEEKLNKQTPKDYILCICIMFITYGLIALIYYLLDLFVHGAGYFACLWTLFGIFVVYFLVCAVAWNRGMKKSKAMEEALIKANLESPAF
ncbi:hypothetical protein PPERSA_11580 [Pseudocohnilembus persalinus]|uniref:Uncharacterized protein n=1 Tax=Pseudocohnilembus persalinus TaxID=266149 RepID=A0A0V0Q9S0_PSEPJ|nr:hypothetical protein PPERSA_11580 [Pseudocohnilembus persalinus]|eukprot:KRW98979.1 hypothetical protein PPERSA_11580 [Pseudocohnilembus persalinus]